MADDVNHRRTVPAGGPLTGDGGGLPHPEALAFRALIYWISLFCRNGNIRLRYRDRDDVTLGNGVGPTPEVTVNRLSALLRMAVRPDLAIGETYMEDGWKIDEKDLARLLGILMVNDQRLESSAPVRFILAVRGLIADILFTNNARRSRRNAAHHYDIGNDLYEAFLDEEMVYSCAFFSREGLSLEAAQRHKLELTLDRLMVEPDMRILDIGCGWGAMTRAIARRGANAVGITLAERQLELAEARAPEALRDRLDYRIEDYRHHAARHPDHYDRIVSIGMFEHVGARYFVDYFATVRQMLKPGGRALIHSIVKNTRSRTNAWIDRYIFPGGFIPRVEDMMTAARTAGLSLPIEPYLHDSRHYATTLRHWRERFNARYPSLDHSRYDERFRRMWNFYLAGSEAAFDALGFRVAQVVVEKDS